MKLSDFIQTYDGEFFLRQHHSTRQVTGTSIFHHIPEATKIPEKYLNETIYKCYPILADRDGRTQAIMIVIIL